MKLVKPVITANAAASRIATLQAELDEANARRKASESRLADERRRAMDMVAEVTGRTRQGAAAVRSAQAAAALRFTLTAPPAPPSAGEAALMDWIPVSGLFDEAHYGDIFRRHGLPLPNDALLHFVRFGLALGLDPSPLFDTAFYIRRNPDVDISACPAFVHFLAVGGFEGRDPNPLFDVRFYLAMDSGLAERANPLFPQAARVLQSEAVARRYNPLVHYVREGAAEGRAPSPYFDGRFYTDTYLDAAPGVNPLVHFLTAGLGQGCQPNALFDVRYYLERHADARASGLNPVEHYVEIGTAKGCKPHPYFDTAFYLDTHRDVGDAGINPLAHFLTNGRAEGRSPNPLFDPAFYRSSASADLPSGTDPLDHYMRCGAREQLRPHADFDPVHYLDANADVREGGCDPLAHFLDYGVFEGRRPNAGFDPGAYRNLHPELRDSAEPPFLHFLRHRGCSGGTVGAEGFADLPWRHDGPSGTAAGLGRKPFRVLFVTHIANRTGAPLCILRLLEQLATRPELDCRVLVNEDGDLTPQFAALVPTLRVEDVAADGGIGAARPAVIDRVARLFREDSTRCLVVVNTAACAEYAEIFGRWGVPVLAWLHELPTSIEAFLDGAATVAWIDRAASRILCPSECVRDALVSHYALDPDKVVAIRNGTDRPPADLDRAAARKRVREEFRLPPDARIVLGCGTVDMRKGTDLFVLAAHSLLSADAGRASDTWFVWVGDCYDARFRRWLEHDATRLGVADRVILAGPRAEPAPYFAAADAFALTSREDPFPMVNMEALSHGLPVAAFEGAGGAVEMLGDGQGVVVPYADVRAMAVALGQLLADPAVTRRRGEITAARIARDCGWDRYAVRFEELLAQAFHYRRRRPLTVSVIIPNYNYAAYLPQRIESILKQTRLPDEIVFIDNRSEDDSVAIARRYAAISPVPFRVVVNESNNGSTFRQWLRGFSLVSGDLVWIAESDDWCEPDFLERVVPEFYDDAVKLAFAQSDIAGPNGEIYAPDYHGYTDELSPTHWRSWYCVPAEEEVALALSQKNSIPNASAVVFRRPDPGAVEAKLLEYRLCGDWWFYAHAIQGGRIAFVPQVLNHHRRHPKTVTHNIEKEDRAIGEALAVKRDLFHTFRVPAQAKCRSVAWSAYEYDRLTRQHDLRRPGMFENPAFASVLSDLHRSIHPDGSARRLRILTVLPDAEVGGGQTAAIRLANALAGPHDSFIVNARPALCDPDVAGLVSDHVLPLEGTLGMTEWAARHDHGPNPNQLAEGPDRIRLLRDLIAFHRIDVVLSHVWWADRLAHAVTLGLGIPWFLRMHGCYEGLMTHPDWDPEFHGMAPSLLQSASGIIYSTTRNLQVFRQYGLPVPQVTVQLFNGFDPAEVPKAPKIRLRRAADEFVFCLCSRAIPEKGWEEAIAAVAGINALPAAQRGGKRARLVLVGGGPYADELAERFAGLDAVDFLGQMPRVVEVVAQCDAGLLPSRFLSESLPSTIIEYFACGIPAVTTDNGSIAEMVSADGRDAALVLPLRGVLSFQAGDLAGLMLRYMTEPDLYAEHKANARYVFDKLFDASHVAGEYLRIMEETLRKNKKLVMLLTV